MANGCRDRGQCRSAERGADLSTGVDDAADDALLGSRDTGSGDHHGAERGTGGAEADEHHRSQQQAVVPVGRELGEHHESGCGDGAREHKDAANADAAGHPGPEGTSGEADNALRSDGQAGSQRRVPEYLLQVQREHEHLAAVPQAEEQVQRPGRAKGRTADQLRGQQRVRVPPLGDNERCQADAEYAECGEDGGGQPAEDVRFGYREHQRGHRHGDQQGAADIQSALPGGSSRISQQPRGDSRREQAHGHVDEEHRAPASELHQDPAEHLAGHEPERGGRAVHSQRPRSRLAVGEAGGDQR